jgi:hypothetical protein
MQVREDKRKKKKKTKKNKVTGHSQIHTQLENSFQRKKAIETS